PAIEDQRAAGAEADVGAARQGGIRLNRDGAVRPDRRRRFAERGATDEPVELDRLVGEVFHPPDQIATVTGCLGADRISRQTTDALGVDHQLPVVLQSLATTSYGHRDSRTAF